MWRACTRISVPCRFLRPPQQVHNSATALLLKVWCWEEGAPGRWRMNRLPTRARLSLVRTCHRHIATRARGARTGLCAGAHASVALQSFTSVGGRCAACLSNMHVQIG